MSLKRDGSGTAAGQQRGGDLRGMIRPPHPVPAKMIPFAKPLRAANHSQTVKHGAAHVREPSPDHPAEAGEDRAPKIALTER